MFAKCLNCPLSFKVALYYQLTVCCVMQIIFSKFLTDTLKKYICILLIFLWIRRVSALPRHPVMNSRIQLLVTMAILRRRYRNRLMLLSSPFVLRIYSLPPPFIFEQNSHKGRWWLIQRIKTKVIIVVILTQDKLQGYEWDKNTKDIKYDLTNEAFSFFSLKKIIMKC